MRAAALALVVAAVAAVAAVGAPVAASTAECDALLRAVQAEAARVEAIPGGCRFRDVASAALALRADRVEATGDLSALPARLPSDLSLRIDGAGASVAGALAPGHAWMMERMAWPGYALALDMRREGGRLMVERATLATERAGSVAVTATLSGIAGDVLPSGAAALALRLETATLDVETAGLFEALALPVLVPVLLDVDAPAPPQVAALRAEAHATLAAMVAAEPALAGSVAALRALVAEMPHPRGRLSVTLEGGGLGAADALALSSGDVPTIARRLAAAGLSATWTPAR